MLPRTGEVLVRIKAAAVNPLDGIIRMGNFPIAKTPPLILGEEATGVVEGNEAGFKEASESLSTVAAWACFGTGRGRRA